MSNPIVEQKAKVKTQKVKIHLLVSDKNGTIISSGRPTLAVGSPKAPKAGLHKWSPACGAKITMTPGTTDMCTGDVMAVSCENCIASDLFWKEAKVQYPNEAALAEEEDVDEGAEEVTEEAITQPE